MPTWLQIVGTIVVLGCAAPFVWAKLAQQWLDATVEDSRWSKAKGELDACVEISGLDTRYLRPWGDSAAAERFVMQARALGHGWLEPSIAPLHLEAPLAIRALAGEIDGTKVAFVLARTRRMGDIANSLALGESGVEEGVPELGAHVNVLADHDVLDRGHVREEADVLEGPGDPQRGHRVWPERQRHRSAAHGAPDAVYHGVITCHQRGIAAGKAAHGIDSLPVEIDLARARLVESRNHVEDRRLASAIRADHGKDLALFDAQIDLVDSNQPTEPLGQPAGFQ